MKDLNLLYVFEAMWRDRSVTLAAENLGLTQAAVSSALKRLRQEHGDKMFTLVGRRMEPTPYAVQASQHLLTALDLIRRASGRRAPFDPAISRRLFTIRTRDVGEVVCFPQILHNVAQAAPFIRLRTTFQPIEETVAGLASGRMDLALGFLPSLETSIHRRPLFTQNYVCVVRKGHPLADGKLTRELFCRYDHLLVEYSGSGHQVIERGLLDAGLRNQIRIRLPQYLSAPHFIMTSDLVWCAPSSLAERLARHYPLVLKPVPISLPTFEIALYWHDRFHQDSANQWLRDVVARASQESLEL
ncbi:MAG TPA: LysR family transcriptional regulator [Pusillimonas sp.]|uniref:LysR family transcriptional regulator n=1 Tax=Pusillimonas sp. TaxID=3040095 RepID=UPI002C326C71|nr:LysR family transcriptional regulator [Pusillimonas sp.]HUH86482.1 LysR family transcriptional regulator [Pusillimonas sp.]